MNNSLFRLNRFIRIFDFSIKIIFQNGRSRTNEQNIKTNQRKSHV
jgi:hypothetical protein